MDGVSRDTIELANPADPADCAAIGTGQGTRLAPAKLELLDWAEWDRNKVYDERLQICLHYLIA
jgi:hypothetical protein